RSWLVYGTLLAIWIVLMSWQAAEHIGVRRSARTTLRHRAEDISSTLALIMRSRGLFASKERIESWLHELVKQGEVNSIELLNAAGEKVASAGAPIDFPKSELASVSSGELWDDKAQTVTLVNLVDLGMTNIIMSASEFQSNRPPQWFGTNGPPPTNFAMVSTGFTNGPPPGTNEPDVFRRGRGRPRFTEEEIKTMRQNKSAHDFIMVMPTDTVNAAINRDFWLRTFIGLLATVSVVGYGLAWSNAGKTSELQIRLIRASELNSHLKEMNLAAAGLAHETRNPLNIVRGLAQMISKQNDASPEIRLKSKEIINETDRVAAQLNEFINYSRPREVRRASTRLNSVVGEVTRALNYDIEEKKVRVENLAEDLVIEADEQLLRQALFNLVLNATQAVQANGEIRIRGGKQSNTEAYIEIADNGPGVAPEHRTEIFKPYFTTHEEGTGLGLAVVQQIVLAHGWEIQCLPNQPAGACFRITHVKLAMKS
ncbi:MAG: Sensor protein ZraS, partial [Pedosphaera sp.]|nr:Sensor protein ZraS [Pedosphaera sp.]